MRGPGRIRQLPLVTLLVVGARVRLVRQERAANGFVASDAGRTKKPQAFLRDGASQGRLVHRVGHGFGAVAEALGIVGGRRLRAPVIVRERRAKRAAERVSAGLRDRADHPAGKAAVFRRHAGGRHGHFLESVLDVEGIRGAPQVFDDDGAVQRVEVFVRQRAVDGERAARPCRMNRRRHQHDGVNRPVRRERRHQILLERRGDLRRLGKRLRIGADDRDRFGDGGHGHRGVNLRVVPDATCCVRVTV